MAPGGQYSFPLADMMSWRDDMLAWGANWQTPLGAAKRRKTTDQVVASTDSSGSTSAFDPKQAADTAREYMQHQSIARPSIADPEKVNQLPGNATAAAQTAPVRVTAKPVASEAISEQKGTGDADAELTARAERLRETLWHTGKQRYAQQRALEEQMKRSEAETSQATKQEALAKAEAAQKAVEELLAEEEQAAHQAAAKKAKKDRRKAKKQQQQEEELLQRHQQQEEELLQRQQQQEEEQLQHQQQQEEEKHRVQQEMRHQQHLQEEQKQQQQKQAKQHAQKLQKQAQVQELQEDQTQQEWQELQRQGKQQQKQQRSVEQPPLQVHTQQAGHAAGGSNTGTAASTVRASNNSAAEQTQLVLSPEPMHVKQSSGLGSSHRQTAKTVRLDHAEPGHDVGGQHERGAPTVDSLLVTGQQKRFAAPHHLLCCPITQVCHFLFCNVLSTLDCRPPAKVACFMCKLCCACSVCFWMGSA